MNAKRIIAAFASQRLYRLASLFTLANLVSLVSISLAIAQPLAAPVPLLPANGDTIIIPTFTWESAAGAHHYRVRVGPQSDPNLVYWGNSSDDTTLLTTLTPASAAAFRNGALYWQVGACPQSDDSGNLCAWSAKVNFTKHIPAPVLVSPHNHIAVAEPSYAWEAVQGAAYYTIEVSLDSSFNSVNYRYVTYGTELTPDNTQSHGTLYWRVIPADARAHPGTPSDGWQYVKGIAPPVMLSPAHNVTGTLPTLTWEQAEGAATYKVDLSADPAFNAISQTLTTYNTSLTPVGSIPNGRYYWRLRGVDADGHEGTAIVRSFYKAMPAPIPLAPSDNETVTLPALGWQMSDGAASYRVDISRLSSFNAISQTLNTYGLRVIPATALQPLGKYYWRVRGVDANGNLSPASATRSFNLVAPAAAADSMPVLQTPADTESIKADPTFRWTAVISATTYRVIVSNNNFVATYDLANTPYTSYAPFEPGYKYTYAPNGYVWKVEARRGSTLLATSAVRAFTRQTGVLLSEPADAAALTADPAYRWQPVVGAKYYQLIVSTSPTFNTTYDLVDTHYTAYTPYTPGFKDAYANGTYYWKVEARDHTAAVIAVSEARRFTKQMPVIQEIPLNTATLWSDPSFGWRQVVGAKTYRVTVSTDPAYGSTYDSVVTDYAGFTPYTPGFKNAYANGVYYWKLEARDSTAGVIAASVSSIFTKALPLPLYGPADGAVLTTTPTFAWQQHLGARTYRLNVSTNPAFSTTYDQVTTDYTTYTPYKIGFKDVYTHGLYYWRVEARDSTAGVIATSLASSFVVTGTATPSNPTVTPGATQPTDPAVTVSPTGPVVTSTVLPPTVTPGPTITGKKTLGNVTVYANSFSDLGSGTRFSASGQIRIGTASAPYVEYIDGAITLDYNSMTIDGSANSAASLLMDNGSATPLFIGAFSVDSNTGELRQQGTVTFQLGRLGDMSVDSGYPLGNFVVNVLQGNASATARVLIYPIEGVYPTATVNFTLNHNGSVSGNIGVNGLEFEAAGLTFIVQNAAFSYSTAGGGMITVGNASIEVPEMFSLGATGSVRDLVITASGLQRLGGGTIRVSLPDISVPGTDGKFKLAGALVELTLEGGGKYKVHGEAGFEMPNITSAGKDGDGSIGIYAAFDLDQDGLIYVLIGGTIDPGIPIGQSGFALTGLEGSVTLRPEVRIQVTGTIESQLELPVLGPAISGKPSMWVQVTQPYGIGISGSLKVFVFDAAEASLSLSQDRGLEGTLHIEYPPYLLTGDASLHVWRADGRFHFTGSAVVSVGFTKGQWWSKCFHIPFDGNTCINIPPFSLSIAEIGAEFGEFCSNSQCTSTVYGLKGTESAFKWDQTFFIDVNGNMSLGGDAREYSLYTQPLLANGTRGPAAAPYTNTHTYNIGATDQALFMLGWQSGDPLFTLVDPSHNVIDPNTQLTNPAVYYTRVLTNAFYVVNDPEGGVWTVRVGKVVGNEGYALTALGSIMPPTVTVSSVISTGVNTRTIGWEYKTEVATSTLTLYYGTSPTDTHGTVITQGVNLAAGTYAWNTAQVKTGEYTVYAAIDDHLNPPVIGRYPTPIHIVNTQPPTAPTGLQTIANAALTSVTVCWNRNAESDVVGYRVFNGSLSGVYNGALIDAANLTCASVPVQPWQTDVYIALTAYDHSGNESALTSEAHVVIDRSYRVYMPMVRKQ